MVLNPGKLNVLFTLQTISSDADGYGGTQDPEWTEMGKFWGSLKKQNNNRELAQTAINTNDSYIIHTFYMTELDGLTERARLITDTGKTLYITYVENIDEKNEVHQIFAHREL
jgi:head-tail adaptor